MLRFDTVADARPTQQEVGNLAPITSKRPSIVLFDMDGTMVSHVNPRVLRLLERLDDASHHAARMLAWRPLRLAADREGPGGDRKVRRPRLLVHRVIHRLRRKQVDQIVRPCPGVYAVLDLLRQHRIPMGIVSNGMGRGYGHDVLKAFGLDTYFDVKVFREDVARAKPHPDSLLQALRGLGREVSSQDVVWYVGDQRKDVLAALRASETTGPQVRPIACGIRASLAIVEQGLGTDQIMLTMEDLRLALSALFGPGATEGVPAPVAPLSSYTDAYSAT